MENYDLKLLDCTLRDGGYINEWKWGYGVACNIIRLLVKAGVDIVEVGFLRNIEGYARDIAVCNYIEELNRLLPDNVENTMFSAMAMRSSYDISKLSPYNGKGIELIRVTAHDYDISEGIAFAGRVKEKGYKVSINPINIMGYSDTKLLQIIEQVNEIYPFQFSIVDTFGSMKSRDLDRIVSLVDNNLAKGIRLGLHLHENMSLSCALAQNFVNKHLMRNITIDGSLVGMGRIPGNLPIELIADYLNEYADSSYDIDFMMDAIQDYIEPLKGKNEWGYTPAYFLSAKFNLHRNYAEYYIKKGDLTNRDINHLLSRIDIKKSTVFDAEYADELYCEYMNNKIDDRRDWTELQKELAEKNILVIAPGYSIKTHEQDILEYIRLHNPIVISANFVPENIPVSYAFFSNNKRFTLVDNYECKVIATSNLSGGSISYHINYNSIAGAFKLGCNSLIMLLTLLKKIGIKKLALAGADGYSTDGNNYFDTVIHNEAKQGDKFNSAASEALYAMGIELSFITPSAYEKNSK